MAKKKSKKAEPKSTDVEASAEETDETEDVTSDDLERLEDLDDELDEIHLKLEDFVDTDYCFEQAAIRVEEAQMWLQRGLNHISEEDEEDEADATGEDEQ